MKMTEEEKSKKKKKTVEGITDEEKVDPGDFARTLIKKTEISEDKKKDKGLTEEDKKFIEEKGIIGKKKPITLDELMPKIKTLKETKDFKLLKEIINSLPYEDTDPFLVAAVFEVIIKEIKLKKSILNKIYKSTHKPLTTLKEKVEIIKKRMEGKIFQYDGNIIEIKDKNIYFITYDREGNIIEKVILKGKLKLLSYTKDPIDKIILFTFNFRGEKYITMSVMDFLKKFRQYTHKGEFGRDLIKSVFTDHEDFLEERKPKLIMGWDSEGAGKWILPFLEEKDKDNKYSIICNTDYQKRAYNAGNEMIKEYSLKETAKIIDMIKLFVEKTQMDKTKLAIIIGWAMAAPFRMLFMDKLNLYPTLILIGSKSTGKSYIAEFWNLHFYRIWKKPLDPYQLSSPSRTEDYMSTSTFPIVIQEVAYINKEIVPILKAHMTGSSDFERKSSATEGFSKPKVTPMSLDSNFEIKQLIDSAVISKILNLKFIEKDRIEREDEWVDLFNKLKKEKLFTFIYNHTKDWTNKDIIKELKHVKDKMGDSMKEIEKTHNRLTDIYTMTLFGINLFEKCFKFELYKDEILDELIKSRGSIAEQLLYMFKSFCIDIINYQLLCDDCISFGKPIPRCHISYISHGLEMNRDRKYIFTQNNLKDFNDFIRSFGTFPYHLNILGELLNDALPKDKKEWIKHRQTTFKGKTQWAIVIDADFIPKEELISKPTTTEEEEKNHRRRIRKRSRNSWN